MHTQALRYFLSIVLAGIVWSATCQTQVSNDTLHWNGKRPLAWEDFRGEPIEGIAVSGEVFCMNLANFVRPGAFQKTRFTVVSIFDRTKSWINSAAKSELGLKYFQVMFNIYEVHARNLRKDLATSKFSGDPTQAFQAKYNLSMTNLTNEFNEFRRQTKLGSDSVALDQWKVKVDEELKALEDYGK
jgi:hypothetical protein